MLPRAYDDPEGRVPYRAYGKTLNEAAALGYAGLTPFMRAFHRWTGTSPGHWRKATRAT